MLRKGKYNIWRTYDPQKETEKRFSLNFSGCQDPWHYNPEVKLPACTNISIIRGSYNEGPAAFGWDDRFWDYPYMAEKEISALERDGMICKSPCDQVLFDSEPSYTTKLK